MSPSDADDERSGDPAAHRDDEHAARDEATSTEEPRPTGSSDVPGAPVDDAAREAAAWQAIIDNYGDRPTLDEGAGPTGAEASDEAARPAGSTGRAHASRPALGESPLEQEDGAGSDADAPDDHYVPPPPPPVPSATPPRLLAWLGLFGVPLLTLVALLAGIGLPQWLSVVLMGWFVGGFVFLVASMRPGPRDDHDDGAVV